MEYIAKIIQEQKVEDKMFWKYTFLDIQNNKEDYFLNTYQINYLPNFVGMLEVLEDKSQQIKFFQSFNQIDDTAKEFQLQETLIQLEKEGKESIKEVDIDLVKKKKLKLTSQKIFKLREEGLSWKWIRNFCGVSEWTIRRWKKEKINQPKQKRGRKLKITGDALTLLLTYANSHKYNTSTQRKMADYLFQKTGQLFDQSVISRTLKRNGITHKKTTPRYSEQKSRIKDAKDFANYFMFVIFPHEEVLALDECSFHLNEAPRYAYSRKGLRATIWKPGNKGSNYTLILCIKNIKEKGIIHYQLIEGGVKSQNLHDFLEGINLPNDKGHYLWLDNAKVHHSTYACQKLGLPTVKEQLSRKKIHPRFLPSYTPQLNPVELCFNIIRQYVEKSRPRTFEELKKTIDEAINIINQKDLTKFFWHCLSSFSSYPY